MKSHREQLHTQYIPDRFSLKRLLGSGGFGFVYEVFDHERETTVALKALTEVTPTSLSRFKREFRSLADIVHPNLITLYELHSDGNLWFFTMELIQGHNFFNHVYQTPLDISLGDNSAPTPAQSESIDMLDTQEWTTSPPSSLRFSQSEPFLTSSAVPHINRDRLNDALIQLTRGIRILHNANKLHRDIKPSNVLVSQQGRVVVLDFGLIQDINPHSTDAFLKEKETKFIGTPHYMSPEQAMGERITTQSDWYSVGVMLYQLLTGHYPVRGTSNLQILLRKQSIDPKHVLELNPDAPEELAELCMGLLSRNPSERPTCEDILSTLKATPQHRRSRTLTRRASFVGRTPELETLKSGLASLRATQTPTLATISGPSGIGKSALCQRFLRHAHKYDDICILQSRCYENESVPYKAFDGIIDQFSQHMSQQDDDTLAPLLPKHLDALTRLFPSLLRVPLIERQAQQHAQALDIDSLHHRQRAFEALGELLNNMSTLTAMVLYLDDVQWADEDSAQLLNHLWSQTHPPTCMMLISHRPDDMGHPFIASLEELKSRDNPFIYTAELKLGTLNTDEAEQVIYDLLSQTPAASKYMEHIINEAAGNPFFIDELTRYARENPSAFEARDEHTLEDILYERICALPTHARALLEMISLSGQPLALSTAHKALNERDKTQDILALLRSELLIRIKTNKNIRLLETYHDRIRETIVARMSKQHAQQHHLKLAKTLSTLPLADPEQVARHFIRAKHQRQAIPYLTQAAQQAERTLAFEHAARLYETLLELDDYPPEQCTTLHHTIGRLRGWLGHGNQAAHHFIEASKHATFKRAFDFKHMAANQLMRVGHYQEGLELLDALLVHAHIKRPKSNAGLIGSILKNRTKLFLRGVDVNLKPVDTIDDATKRRLELCWSASQATSCFDLKLGAHFSLIHLTNALESGHPHHTACGLMLEAVFLCSTRKNQRKGQQLVLTAQSLIDQSDDRDYAQGLMCFTKGMIAYLTEQWKEAHDQWGEGIEFLQQRRPELAWEVEGMRFYQFTALAQRGELHAFIEDLPGLIHATQTRQDIHYGTAYQLWHHLGLLAQDQPQRALQTIDALQPQLREAQSYRLHHYWNMLALINIHLYTGDCASAWITAQAEWGPLKRSLLLQSLDVAHALALDTFGRAALAYCTESHKLVTSVHQTLKKLKKLPASASARAYAAAIDVQLTLIISKKLPSTDKIERAITLLQESDMSLRALALRVLVAKHTDDHDEKRLALDAIEDLGAQNPMAMATLYAPALIM